MNNSKTLNLYPIDYPFETLVQRMTSDPAKTLLDPDFQRKYKWDKDGWSRASSFIESCLMRIPLPSCYFAEDENSKHLVIDGVQRLTTIRRFFNDEFPLENLSTFKELEGKRFSELGDFKSELETTTIRCIVLRKENPKKLIREIFARLNQGAVKLSDQEIRNAVYPGTFNDLLIKLSQTPEVKNFGKSERISREAEEQVLRFFAFSDDKNLKNFGDTLSDYLNNYMEKKMDISEDEASELKTRFLSALENCKAVFGDELFMDPGKERPKQGLAYYDLLMVSLGEYELKKIRKNKKEIYNAFVQLCKKSDFKKTLSGGVQKKTSIMLRKKLWGALLSEIL